MKEWKSRINAKQQQLQFKSDGEPIKPSRHMSTQWRSKICSARQFMQTLSVAAAQALMLHVEPRAYTCLCLYGRK